MWRGGRCARDYLLYECVILAQLLILIKADAWACCGGADQMG